MIRIPISIDAALEGDALVSLDRIATALERIADEITRKPRLSLTFHFEGKTMPHVFKADDANFDFTLQINGVDSEGNIIKNIPIPSGHTLTVTSDNPAAFAVTQDATEPRLVHAVVGGPNADGTPSQANVIGTLFDAASNMVATGSDLETVTAGDPTGIASISFTFPQDSQA